MRSALLFRVLAALMLAAVSVGCTADAKKARYAKRAENYFKAGDYEKAKIEYLNVLRLDALNPIAIERLGTIWSEQGAPRLAFPFLRKMREIAPDDLETRVKLARAFMALGHIAEARKEAEAILEKAAGHEDAILLVVEAARTKEEIAAAEEQLEKFSNRETAGFHVAAAYLALRKADPGQAQTELNKALTADPKSIAAHGALGAFYLLQNDRAKAGEAFKVAAELSPLRSLERLRFAEFKAQTGEVEEADRLIKEMTKAAPDFLPAWRLQAQIAFITKKYSEALALLENVFSRDPDHLDCRMLQSQIWLAMGEVKKAVEGLNRLDKRFPNVPQIKFQLARALLQDGNQAEAIGALDQAVAANPGFVEAHLLSGELSLRSGDAERVAASMTDLLKKRPDLPQAELLLAEAYRALGRLDAAAAIFQEQIKRAPENPLPHLFLGLILRQQNKIAEARASLEKALQLTPDDLRIVYQLVDLDLIEKKPGEALQRARKEIEKTPQAAAAHFLEGRIHAYQNDWDLAEAAMQKTLDLDPNFTSAYDLLISVYVTANKLPEARAQVDTLLAKSPGNVRALMTSGLVHGRMNENARARDAYAKLLAAKPNFAPALNNLAYLHGEANELDQAFEFAKKARALQPNDPSIADTLGWILYKRGDYQGALALLQESAGKSGETPEIQFHLGMASYMMGQPEIARGALQQAANATLEFPGKDEARRRLALLGDAVSGSKESSIEELKKLVAGQPDDILARMRLAEAFERQGQAAEAAGAYEAVLKINPRLPAPNLKLAQLYAGPLGNKGKALEWARKARELAPNDARAGAILGELAYKSDNYSWAYSLLQESARGSKDPKVLHTFAWAAYSLGKVNEAREAMQAVLNLSPDAPESADAKTFVAMTQLLEADRGALSASQADVESALRKESNYVPALMARGVLEQERKDRTASEATFTAVLRRFPDFAPAQKHLASLYADDPQQHSKAYDLAIKARRTLAGDAELAEILGGLSYHRKEYAYAIQLFQESARKRPLGARALYYLGMSQVQNKEKSEGREALERALAGGLPEPMAAEAKRTIAEL